MYYALYSVTQKQNAVYIKKRTKQEQNMTSVLTFTGIWMLIKINVFTDYIIKKTVKYGCQFVGSRLCLFCLPEP